jgi:dTDP-4-dehydrorhamnose reductase
LGRSNFLTVVKDKLENGEVYNVFHDQVRTPTYIEDLATGIVAIIQKKATGIFHLSGESIITLYEIACMTADHLGYDKRTINRVTETEFSQPAKRPKNTTLVIEKAKQILGFHPISFKDGLEKTLT